MGFESTEKSRLGLIQQKTMKLYKESDKLTKKPVWTKCKIIYVSLKNV